MYERKWLSQKITESDLSKTKIAKRAGISPNHLRNLEVGKNKISLDQLRKFIDLFGISSDEVYELLIKRNLSENESKEEETNQF